MTEQVSTFQPDWISPPGESIADLLEERGWSQAELAQRSGYTTKHVSQLINGKAAITEDTALKLERVLGSTANFWLSREARYRESVARRAAYERLAEDKNWLTLLPLTEMITFGWVRRCDDKGQQISECLSFFGVASVEAWKHRYADPLAAFRASTRFSMDAAAVATWLRQGERCAAELACECFNKAAVHAALPELRDLTNEPDPQVFVPKLIEIGKRIGIAITLEDAPKGCPASGATRWLAPNKALLMLSLRHKSNDHLWFSLFHEIGHLLLHGKKMFFLELKTLDGKHEQEADRFASDQLIPPPQAKKLPSLGCTKAAVRAFAKTLGIAPGIVVGRMQKEGLLPWSHLNGLKVHYRWKHDGWRKLR